MGRHKKLSKLLIGKKRKCSTESTKTDTSHAQRTTSINHLHGVLNSRHSTRTERRTARHKLNALDTKEHVVTLPKTIQKRSHQRHTYRRSARLLPPTTNTLTGRRTGEPCFGCGGACVIDVERAIRSCSQCGMTERVLQRKITTRDIRVDFNDKDAIQVVKFCEQYRPHFPLVPKKVLTMLYNNYRKVHFHHATRVTSCRTYRILRRALQSNSCFLHASERISKILRADPIPELTKQQIVKIIYHQKILQTLCPQSGISMLCYIRYIALANGVEAARLLGSVKTPKIHKTHYTKLKRQFDAFNRLPVHIRDGLKEYSTQLACMV